MTGRVDTAGEAARHDETTTGNLAGKVPGILDPAAGWISAADYRDLRLPERGRISRNEQSGRRRGNLGKEVRVVFATPGNEMPPGMVEPFLVDREEIFIRIPQVIDGPGVQPRAPKRGIAGGEKPLDAAECFEQADKFCATQAGCTDGN
jgi:hypothetical protein